MRFFLRLAYLGAPFHGWQRQPNAVSVQQRLEESLSTLLRREVAVTGAGRTDTGVNAATMWAHFDGDERCLDPGFLRGLNRLVGRDVAVYGIVPVREDAHARFDATSRTYKYFIAYQKSPFFHQLSWQSPSRLDMERMNHCASMLLATEDFTSFAKLHSDAKTNICHVTQALFEPLAHGDGLVFTISADRFLRNMVRAVVGTLVDAGRGKLSEEDFRAVIEAKNRCAAGTSMPAEALYLWDISYPPEIFITDYDRPQDQN